MQARILLGFFIFMCALGPWAVAGSDDARGQMRDLQRQQRNEVMQLEQEQRDQIDAIRHQFQERRMQIEDHYEEKMEALQEQSRQAREQERDEMKAQQEQHLGQLYNELGLDREKHRSRSYNGGDH